MYFHYHLEIETSYTYLNDITRIFPVTWAVLSNKIMAWLINIKMSFFQNIRGNAAVETCVLTGLAVKSDAVLISMRTAIHMDFLSRSLFIELE